MKSILYLMNVNWGWIKQRPHFLAEELCEFFQVDVFYQKHYKKGKDDNKAKGLPQQLNLHELFRLPLDERIGILKSFNLKLIQNKLNRQSKNSAFIWYSKPDHVQWFSPRKKTNAIKIYDCMDDMLAFPDVMNNPDLKNLIFKMEKELIDNCEIILASSDYLAAKLRSRYSTNKDIHVVNNAMHFYSKKENYSNPKFEELKKNYKVLTYVGTIAEWFEFEKVIKGLDKTKNTVLVLFGPASVKIPVHPKIFHLGTIEHKLVADVMEKSDALILPFEVNELIEAVNPVKMYEYIHSGNHVIASRYGETLKFEPYANLYSNENELVDLLIKLDNESLSYKQDKSNCLAFAQQNTWKARAKIISDILKDDVKA